jgi:hypothetical protein
MTAKGARAHKDENRSQQPRQETAPSSRERHSAAVEDDVKNRERLSDRSSGKTKISNSK